MASVYRLQVTIDLPPDQFTAIPDLAKAGESFAATVIAAIPGAVITGLTGRMFGVRRKETAPRRARMTAEAIARAREIILGEAPAPEGGHRGGAGGGPVAPASPRAERPPRPIRGRGASR
jgi:hypothetical protein